jgi:hypothetical protein
MRCVGERPARGDDRPRISLRDVIWKVIVIAPASPGEPFVAINPPYTVAHSRQARFVARCREPYPRAPPCDPLNSTGGLAGRRPSRRRVESRRLRIPIASVMQTAVRSCRTVFVSPPRVSQVEEPMRVQAFVPESSTKSPPPRPSDSVFPAGPKSADRSRMTRVRFNRRIIRS